MNVTVDPAWLTETDEPRLISPPSDWHPPLLLLLHLRILSILHPVRPSQLLLPFGANDWRPVPIMEYLPSLQQEFDELKPSLFGTCPWRTPQAMSTNTRLTRIPSQSYSPNNSCPTFCLPQSDTSLPSRPIAIHDISFEFSTPTTRSTRCSPSSSNATTCAPSAAPSQRTSTPSNANESSSPRMARSLVPSWALQAPSAKPSSSAPQTSGRTSSS